LGLGLSLASLVLAMRGIDPGEVAATLRTTQLEWLLAAMLVVVISAVLKAVRWRLLFAQGSSHAKPPIGMVRLTGIWLAGTSLNLALPAPRSGDLARAYFVGEAGRVSKSWVLGTIAAEKLLDTVMLAVCFVALLPFVVLPQELSARRGSVVGVAILLVMVVFLILRQRHRLLHLVDRLIGKAPNKWGEPVLGRLERAAQGLDAFRSPRVLAGLSLISVLIWVLSAYTNYLIFPAVGLTPSWLQSFFLLVVLQTGIAVPSTPGKVGIFQVLCRWSLGLFGVSAALGMAYGILLYLAAPVLLMVLGAAALGTESWQLRRLPVDLDGRSEEGGELSGRSACARNSTRQP
jgi:hypothetical protein